jgi:hypothetical protein
VIRIGTSYFVDRQAAERYYGSYGNVGIDVTNKILAGEIKLGKPPVKPGQRLEIIDNGTRYAIVEG